MNGELVCVNGILRVTGHDDVYNAEPFGDDEPVSPSAVPSTTRGFYNEEFSPLNLEADCKRRECLNFKVTITCEKILINFLIYRVDEDRRLELARIDRELDTPDSVVSSSSPECIIPRVPARFAGNEIEFLRWRQLWQ